MMPFHILSGGFRFRWPAGLGLLLAGLFCLTGRAAAHPILQNPIWMEVAPDRMQVKLYVSMRELNVVQGLPIAADGAVDMALAVETAPRHSGYVLDHLTYRADGLPLQGAVTSIDPPGQVGKGAEGPDRAHFIYHLTYPLAVPPARISFSHSMVKEFPSAPGVPWDLSYTYRFGPLGAVPKEFGALSREAEVVYTTGFPAQAGALPVTEAVHPVPPLLIRLALLGAALGLGIASRSALVRTLGVAAAAWALGWGLASACGWKMPGFLASALGGIGILLASVDNIHRAPAAPQLRRWVLALFFPAAAGVAAWTLAAVGSLAKPALAGQSLAALLGGGLMGAALAMSSAARPPIGGAAPKRVLQQLASLLVCLGGLMVLLDGLGLRPWAYWLTRLGG